MSTSHDVMCAIGILYQLSWAGHSCVYTSTSFHFTVSASVLCSVVAIRAVV